MQVSEQDLGNSSREAHALLVRSKLVNVQAKLLRLETKGKKI
jgi:hypothetical protein